MSLRTSVATLVWQSVPLPSLWERCPAGVESAFLPSQSLRDSSPRVGAKGGNERNGLTRRLPVRNDNPYLGAYKPAGALWPVYHNFENLEFYP